MVLSFFLVSCATAPPSSQSPALPFGEFVDQVLDPLTGKIADQGIQQAQAELNSRQMSPSLLSLLGLADTWRPGTYRGEIALVRDGQGQALDGSVQQTIMIR